MSLQTELAHLGAEISRVWVRACGEVCRLSGAALDTHTLVTRRYETGADDEPCWRAWCAPNDEVSGEYRLPCVELRYMDDLTIRVEVVHPTEHPLPKDDK